MLVLVLVPEVVEVVEEAVAEEEEELRLQQMVVVVVVVAVDSRDGEDEDGGGGTDGGGGGKAAADKLVLGVVVVVAVMVVVLAGLPRQRKTRRMLLPKPLLSVFAFLSPFATDLSWLDPLLWTQSGHDLLPLFPSNAWYGDGRRNSNGC